MPRHAAQPDLRQAASGQKAAQDRQGQPLDRALRQLEAKPGLIPGCRIGSEQPCERARSERRSSTPPGRRAESPHAATSDRPAQPRPAGPARRPGRAGFSRGGKKRSCLWRRACSRFRTGRADGAGRMPRRSGHPAQARGLPCVAQPVPDTCPSLHDSMTTLVCFGPDNIDGRDRPLTRLLLLLLLIGGVLPATVPAYGQVPPDEDWRTLDTEHFGSPFPKPSIPGDALADRAERAYGQLASSFSAPPPGAIDIVLTDHADYSNGFANVVPGNRITLFAARPRRGVPQLFRRVDRAGGHARVGAHLSPGSRGWRGRHPARGPGPLPRHLALFSRTRHAHLADRRDRHLLRVDADERRPCPRHLAGHGAAHRRSRERPRVAVPGLRPKPRVAGRLRPYVYGSEFFTT